MKVTFLKQIFYKTKIQYIILYIFIFLILEVNYILYVNLKKRDFNMTRCIRKSKRLQCMKVVSVL